MNMGMMMIGMRIRMARTAQRMKAIELSALTGITQTQISRIEAGKDKSMRLDTAVLIADALHMSLDEMTGRSEYMFRSGELETWE